ncbi:MAG: peptide deformylase [Eggerthellaceae bacterium]|jgi:peptide deformylase|nr:peptide deformylase [Eggerthellaceae bacterium]
MDIILSPDPLLRQVCEPCDLNDKSLKRLAKKMAQAMYKNNGVGLAAPQVGVLKRLIVVDCDPEHEVSETQSPIYLLNPVIVDLEGEGVSEDEGCLSCPGISVPVTRQPFVRVRYFDLDGEEWILEGDGLLGRCLQHEIDHLNGKTLFESCDPPARLAALRDYEEALARGAKPGDMSLNPHEGSE